MNTTVGAVPLLIATSVLVIEGCSNELSLFRRWPPDPVMPACSRFNKSARDRRVELLHPGSQMGGLWHVGAALRLQLLKH